MNVGISLNSNDLDVLCKKYDNHGDGYIHYTAFLRRFSAIGRISSRNSGRDSHMVFKFLNHLNLMSLLINTQSPYLQSLKSGRMSSFSYNLSRAASCTSLDSAMRPDSARSVSRAIVSQMGLRRSTTNLGDLTPGPGIDPPEYVLSSLAPYVVQNWKQLRKQFKV